MHFIALSCLSPLLAMEITHSGVFKVVCSLLCGCWLAHWRSPDAFSTWQKWELINGIEQLPNGYCEEDSLLPIWCKQTLIIMVASGGCGCLFFLFLHKPFFLFHQFNQLSMILNDCLFSSTWPLSSFLYFCVLHSQPANCDDEGMTLCEQLS